MSSKQLSIPGLPVPVTQPKPKALNIQRRIADLQERVAALELELSLLRILMEKGDKDHV